MNEKCEAKRMSTKTMALIAVMTAVTCIIAPISIPIGPIPISLGTLAFYFGIYILGTRLQVLSCIVYLIIGFVGMPVFTGFSGGAAKLIGPTGGYLVGYIPMIMVAGLLVERFERKTIPSFFGMIVGTIMCYALGTTWFCIQADYKLLPALMVCVVPFIPGDLIKIVMAVLMGPKIRAMVNRIS